VIDLGERYWITGVQLGLLKVLSEVERGLVIDEIIEKQFMGDVGELKKRDSKGWYNVYDL